jgi:hypothetical protein
MMFTTIDRALRGQFCHQNGMEKTPVHSGGSRPWFHRPALFPRCAEAMLGDLNWESRYFCAVTYFAGFIMVVHSSILR